MSNLAALVLQSVGQLDALLGGFMGELLGLVPGRVEGGGSGLDEYEYEDEDARRTRMMKLKMKMKDDADDEKGEEDEG